MRSSRLFLLTLLVLAASAALAWAASPAPPPPVPSPNSAPAKNQGSPATKQDTATVEAQRQKIWNSPEMMRARAWLDSYFAVAANVTPQQAKEYLASLQKMSPAEMKLWLAKFEAEQRMRQQQEATWQQTRQWMIDQNQTAVERRDAASSQFANSLSGPAEQAQRRIESQQSLQSQMILQRNTFGPFGSGGYSYGFGSPSWGWGPYSW
jgi:hypothetical protein